MLRNNVKSSVTNDPYDAAEAFDDSVFEDKTKNEAFNKRKMSDPELSLIKSTADIEISSEFKSMLLQGCEPLSPGSDTTGAMFRKILSLNQNTFNE